MLEGVLQKAYKRKEVYMILQPNALYYGFQLIEEEWIEEISSMVRFFEHIQSGAKLIQVANEDIHQVFTASFKTIPTDHTGVAHIVEHTVCCASKKYPLKDTFMELDKGSLNTSLNACTYKDMTMYYCASQNEKDFSNLIEVYMDLIFHPLIHERPYLFKQEGWHYSIEDKDEPLSYSGIVYNEMHGEYMEPSTRLENLIHETLFKDTCYRYDSGGKPEEIVKLTEENFLSFYNRYYKPSNCTLFLYGKADLETRLIQLNNVLKEFKKEECEFPILIQQPFKKMERCHGYYPVEEEQQSEEDKETAFLALSFVVGDIHNIELRLAFEMLEHMLLKSPASPLYEALLGENGIGKSIEEGGYDTGKRQPTFSIVLNGTNSFYEETFKERVFKVLNYIVENGIDKDLVEAAYNTVTFSLKEGDTPWEAKGVILSEEVQMGVLYGQHPFTHLKYENALEEIGKKRHSGYFEALIKEYLLNNPHGVCALLEADENEFMKEEKRREEALKAYKESLSEEQLIKLILTNQALEQLQEMPNEPEDLAKLPHLTLTDLPKVPKFPSFQMEKTSNITWQVHPLNTQEIAYIHLLFDTSHIAKEDLTYLGLLSNLLTYIGTKNYTYDALENIINQQTGGLNCNLQAYAHCENTHKFSPYLKISLKVLLDKLEDLPHLLEEITCNTIFKDAAKINELIELMLYEIDRSFKSTPEYRTTRAVYSYCSGAAIYEDYVSGMIYYEFLKELKKDLQGKDNQAFDNLVKKLNKIYKEVMQKTNLVVSITSPKESQKDVRTYIEKFLKVIPNREVISVDYGFNPEIRNEAYIIPSQVQAITTGYNFKDLGYKFSGTLYVLNHILDSTYLWDRIRLQGGAYGCQVTLGRDGNLVICSYCDPELGETLKVIDEIGDFIRNLELSQEELERCIIGTIGSLSSPLTMEQKSEQVLIYGITHVSQQLLEREWQEILTTTIEDLKNCAPLIEDVLRQKALCVIGNKSKIKKEAKRFKKIYTL